MKTYGGDTYTDEDIKNLLVRCMRPNYTKLSRLTGMPISTCFDRVHRILKTHSIKGVIQKVQLHRR